MKFLNRCDVLNKDYKRWMIEQSQLLIRTVDRYAQEKGEYPIVHLQTWREDKEELANIVFHSDVTLSRTFLARLTFSRMFSTFAVQTNRRGALLCSSM